MLSPNPHIGFVGFGEVAFHFSKGLREAGVQKITAYVKAADEPARDEKVRLRAALAGVELVPTLSGLVTQAELIISAAHAQAAMEIAEEVAQSIRPGAIFADLNNLTPSVKKDEARLFDAKGIGFVDIGLLELPVLAGHRALMYVSGSGAEEFKQVMSPFGMTIEIAPGDSGSAAAIKSLMNIYLKGMQALCIEVALSAHKASIPIDLIGRLVAQMTTDVPDEQEMSFWIQRGCMHAGRKTIEVQELVEMMKAWGIDPLMMDATAKRLDVAARYGLENYIGDSQGFEDGQSMLQLMEKIGAKQGIGLR